VKKECPSCRRKITHAPTFSYSISQQIGLLLGSDELDLSKDDKIFYTKRHLQDKLMINRIKNEEDVWNGVFPKYHTRAFEDADDDVR
jgi:hypothetical protein